MNAAATGMRDRWLVLAAITGSLSMVMLDQTVGSAALPTMSCDFGLSGTGQTWVVNAYVLAPATLAALLTGSALCPRRRASEEPAAGSRRSLTVVG